VARYAIALLEGHDPARQQGDNVAIAPDGSSIIYSGPGTSADTPSQLWLRARDQLEPVPMTGTELALQPVFSPDGTKVAFHTGAPGTIKVVSLAGEPPLTIADSAVGGLGVAWGDDDNLYFDTGAGGAGIARVSSGGGDLEQIMAIDVDAGEAFVSWHEVLPGSRTLIATLGYNPQSDRNAYRIVAIDIASGERTVLAAGVFARYSPTGHLLYVSADGQLLARVFDEDGQELTGAPTVLAEGVAVGPFGGVDMAISNDGTLVYMAGELVSAAGRAVWVDRSGDVEPLEMDPFDPGMPEAALVLSPDGQRVAIKVATASGDDIWIKELPDGPMSRLTFDDGVDRRPRWSPDGLRVFYNSDRAGGQGHYDLWAQPADGTGTPEILLDQEASILEARMTQDGSAFVLRLGGLSGSVGDRDLVGLRSGETEPFSVATEPWDEKGVSLSPSGRWVAYESTETGRDEVYVRPFPNSEGGKWQVSVSGGFNPKWARSEDELFFVNSAGEMVVAQVQTDGDAFRVGERRTLFSLTSRFLNGQPNYASWDVSLDDQRFLMLEVGGSADGEVSELIVVQNFFQILEDRVGN
jgi:serine/threonine-protein kinase